MGFVGFGENTNTKQGEIKAIYVLKEAQGLGIGSQLHDIAVKSLYDSHDRLMLNVLQKNKRALQFYFRKGWEIKEETETQFPGSQITFKSYTLEILKKT